MESEVVYDDVRWFDPVGTCQGCKGHATGVLRGSRNDSYGPYCAKCAERRIKRAQQERAKQAAKS